MAGVSGPTVPAVALVALRTEPDLAMIQLHTEDLIAQDQVLSQNHAILVLREFVSFFCFLSVVWGLSFMKHYSVVTGGLGSDQKYAEIMDVNGTHLCTISLPERRHQHTQVSIEILKLFFLAFL